MKLNTASSNRNFSTLPLAAELRPLRVGKEDEGEAVKLHDSGGVTVVPIPAVWTPSIKI
jgi:hypothetical protein